MDMIIRLYYRLVNLYFCRRYRLQHVFSVGDVPFYVPVDHKTRERLFYDCTAFTLGEVVYGRSKRALTDTVIKHELEHVEQFRWAPFYAEVDYRWQTKRNGYWNNHYEVVARKASRRVTRFRRRHAR